MGVLLENPGVKGRGVLQHFPALLLKFIYPSYYIIDLNVRMYTMDHQSKPGFPQSGN
jgi:hypothetical protein